MISISNKNTSLVVKIGLVVLVLYILGFVGYKAMSYYQISYQKDLLTKELNEKRNEKNNIKKKIELTKKRMKDIEKKYITKDELALKINDIFKRMSIFDYNLKYLDAQKMCVDRYILITQLTSNTKNGIKAGEGILSYIGEIKKSDKNETIYFVDYITKAKDIK